jgi:chemotaxis protein CheC
MPGAVDELSELERDALTELVNIAVSGAASRLRAMVGSEVTLKVPVVEVHSADAAVSSLLAFAGEALTVVRQDFAGRIEGQTMLLLSPVDGQVLARAVLGNELAEPDYADLQDDALGEVGNVLLLGLLSTIGSMLGITFQVAIPTVAALDPGEIFPRGDEQVVVLIHVDFSVRQINARGYFAVVLGLGGFAALREILRAFLADILDADAVHATPALG